MTNYTWIYLSIALLIGLFVSVARKQWTAFTVIAVIEFLIVLNLTVRLFL